MAVGTRGAPAAGRSPITPSSSHGLAASRWCDSHQMTIAATTARNAAVMATVALSQAGRAAGGSFCGMKSSAAPGTL